MGSVGGLPGWPAELDAEVGVEDAEGAGEVDEPVSSEAGVDSRADRIKNGVVMFWCSCLHGAQYGAGGVRRSTIEGGTSWGAGERGRATPIPIDSNSVEYTRHKNSGRGGERHCDPQMLPGLLWPRNLGDGWPVTVSAPRFPVGPSPRPKGNHVGAPLGGDACPAPRICINCSAYQLSQTCVMV